jgi:hypothetical protein
MVDRALRRAMFSVSGSAAIFLGIARGAPDPPVSLTKKHGEN